MKKLIALFLVFAMCLGAFAGCKQEQVPGTVPTVSGENGAQEAIDYLAAIYTDDGAKTAVDYERYGIVRIAGVPYTVVWTTDLGEDMIKIVVNDDGTVTIDINEKCEKDTPYVLTATVTDEAGNTASYSWNYILPEAVDMVAIVKEAYQLADGQSMPYEVTLTGKIISINDPYSEEYKNITVVMVVEGAEDMPILCYRLKGEGADELFVDDIITVTGTIKNYKGTIEFDTGCILDKVVPGPRVPVTVPTDPKQIVADAYALPKGASLYSGAEVTLTGKVTKINFSHIPGNGNMSVTIKVEGKEFYCYYLLGKDKDLATININDIITVTGPIKNYNGTIEFDHPELVKITQKAAPKGVTNVSKILKDAAKLKDGKYLSYMSTMKGIVTEVTENYTTEYGNMSFKMLIDGTNGETITCYRVAVKGGKAKVPKAGDRVSVTGAIKKHYGTIEYTGTYDDGNNPYPAEVTLVKRNVGLPGADTTWGMDAITGAPVAGQEYTLGLVNELRPGNPLYFFTGKLSGGYYLDTSTNGGWAATVIPVAVDGVEGGYYLSFIDSTGATKYLNIRSVKGDDGKDHVNPFLEDKAETVYTYDDTAKTLVTDIDGELNFIGTYASSSTGEGYTTFSIRPMSKLDSSIPAVLGALKKVTGPATLEELCNQFQVDLAELTFENNVMTLPTTVKVRNTEGKITWVISETENENAITLKGNKLTQIPQEDGKVGYVLVYAITLGDESASGFMSMTVPKKEPAANAPVNEIMEYLYGLAKGETTDTAYTLTGKIYKFDNKGEWSDQHKNLSVWIEVEGATGDNTQILVYRAAPKEGSGIKGADIKVTDTITVTGKVTNYNGKIEFIQGTTIDKLVPGDGETGGEGGGNEGGGNEGGETTDNYVTAPQTGVAYNLGLNQTSKGAIYYFTGAMSGYYGATDTNVANAAEVYLEAVTGGYNMYFMDGETKNYIYVAVNGDHINFKFGATASVFVFDKELDAPYTTLENGSVYYLGTYDNYVTVGTVAQDKAETSYLVRFYAADGTGEGGGTATPDPKPETPAIPEGPIAIYHPASGKVVTSETELYESKNQVQMVTADATLSNGKLTTAAENVLVVEATLNADGTTYTFSNADGNYLYADGTDVKLVDTEGDHTKFVLEEAEGGYYIMLGTYKYNGTKDQYLECYSGKFTSYGLQSDVTPFVFAFYPVTVGEGGGESGGEGGETPAAPIVPEGTFAIYNPDSGKVATSVNKPYDSKDQLGTADATLSSGKLTTAAENVLQLTASLNEDETTVSFNDGDGNYLYADGTHVKMAAEASDYTKFVVEETEGGYLIKSATATYNDKAQYLEYYSGAITIYTLNTERLNIYTFAFYPVTVQSGSEGGGNEGGGNEGGGNEGGGETTTDPTPDTELSIVDAIALGESKEHDNYTEGKYYITGEITAVENTEHGNMYIKDAEGNAIYVYGTYNADGTVGYADLETKPVAGDTVKLYSMVGFYSTKAQLKNAWIVEHTKGEGATGPALPEVEGASTFTIDIAAYVTANGAGTQYAEETHDFGSGFSMTINKCHLHKDGELRIYSSSTNDGYAEVTVPGVVKALLLNLYYNEDTMNVYGSTDGTNWTLVEGVEVKTGTLEYVVEMPAGTAYTYFKLDVEGSNQLRTKAIDVLYIPTGEGGNEGGEGGETPETPAEPAADADVNTILAYAYGLEAGATTETTYTLTGEVESIREEWSSFGNMSVVIKVDNASGENTTMLIWRAKPADSTIDGAKITVGDKITVSGQFKNYNGTIELANGSITAHVDNDSDTKPPEQSGVEMDFSVAANRQSWDTEEQIWKANGITVTNKKASSSSNVADYVGPARFYKSSSLKIEYSGMTKIVFTCNDYKASYVTDLQASLDSKGTVTVSGTTVTIEFASAVNALEIATLTGQVRMDSLTVYTG